jgi:hypothetical protein
MKSILLKGGTFSLFMESHFFFYEFSVLNFWGINGELSAFKLGKD